MAELLLKLVSKSYFVVIETHWLLSCFLTHILVDVLCCGIALELLDQEFHCTASKSSCKFKLLHIFCCLPEVLHMRTIALVLLSCVGD
jgi:hypothetical protein